MDFIIEDLDWKKILLRRYKSYKLNEEEVIILLLINELNRGAPHLVSVEELEPFTTLPTQRIDQILTKLIELKYVTLSEQDASISIQPLKLKIYKDTIKDIKLEETTTNFSNAKEKAESIYSKLEQVLGRQISSIEYDIICNWFKTGATEEMVSKAIEKVKSKRGNPSVASIDKQILLLQKSKEVSKLNPLDEDQIEILRHDLYGSHH